MKLEELKLEKERLEVLLKQMEDDLFQLEMDPAVQRHKIFTNKRQLLLKEISGIRSQILYYCEHLWYYLKSGEGKSMGKCLKCYVDGEIKQGELYIRVDQPSLLEEKYDESFVSLFQEYYYGMSKRSSDKEFIRKYKPRIM